MRNRAGFTLIELLVVIAITVLLFALLFTPMIASFNLTRDARIKIEVQDAARMNLERISRELSDAMFVYDNSQTPMMVRNPSGTMTPVKFAKIDIIMPRMLMHCNNLEHPANEPRDYDRYNPAWLDQAAWPPCPVCSSQNVESRPIQPLTPAPYIVRYFVGLLDPSQPYNNTYAKLGTSDNNNTYVLYRAEFSPWDGKYVPLNDDGTPDLNYENFFYSNEPAEIGDGSTYSQNWQAVSRIVGTVKNADLISWEQNGADWIATSSIRFTPTAIQNEPLSPTYLSDTDAETPVAIPTVFRGAYGLWTPEFKVMIYNRDFTKIHYTAPYTDNHIWLWRHNASGGDVQVFDITQYRLNGNLVYRTGIPKDEMMTVDVDERLGEVRFAFTPDPDVETPTTQYVNEPDSSADPPKPPHTYVLGIMAENKNARIVPGSEEIMGPDQTPASNGGFVRYARVPLSLGTPGLNQYKIDYDTGEVWFSELKGEELPADSYLRIKYKFHDNGPGDIIRADYVTKNLMTITFGMRVYDPQSTKLYFMELTNKVRIKNTVR